MHFEIQPDGETLDVSVIYRPHEYSFSVENANGPLPLAFTSVQVNELQLQLDEGGRVLYVDGYCPHTGWTETVATPPSACRGTLFVRDIDCMAGVSVALSSSRWPVTVNRTAGWICLGEQFPPASCNAVEFAADSIAVVEDDLLKAIWLKPRELPT